jgi:DNA-directed RNA polymerase subunit H (RpoH/RPB5)
MSSSTNKILTIYNSRKTLVELLKNLQYDMTEYENFTINEIDAMFSNNQLDLLVSKTYEPNRKLYVRYTKQLRPNNLQQLIEDLYEMEQVLTKEDTLVIVMDDEPNDTILSKITHLYERDGIFVVIHNIQRLQYNILNHVLVPTGRILTEKEVAEVKEQYNITNERQFPEISRFDPQSLALCIRPGEVCHFIRKSQTAMFSDFYRICV